MFVNSTNIIIKEKKHDAVNGEQTVPTFLSFKQNVVNIRCFLYVYCIVYLDRVSFLISCAVFLASLMFYVQTPNQKIHTIIQSTIERTWVEIALRTFRIPERVIVLCVYAAHACSFNYWSDYIKLCSKVHSCRLTVSVWKFHPLKAKSLKQTFHSTYIVCKYSKIDIWTIVCKTLEYIPALLMSSFQCILWTVE